MNLSAIPDLTAAQQTQLATADDTRAPDEPAWTGLLVSVATWDPAEAARGFVPGATMPDYGKLLAEPGAYRGELFVVEGRYAGRQREMRTRRAGPWGESLVEWGVLPKHAGPGERQDVVAMVYLVDPAGEITPPREGQTVRLAARFYKTWTDVDADGVPRTYPVFVGRSASVVGEASGGGRGHVAIVGGVIVLSGLLFLVMLARKRRGGPAGGAAQRERVLERLRQDADDAEFETSADDLPDDPAAALEQLERSRGDV